MTRVQFDKVFLEHYDHLIQWARTRMGPEGDDLIHQCYQHIIENATYKNGPRLYASRWIYFKVGREMVRVRKAKRLRDTKTWEARDTIIGAMKERESLERPDTNLMARELQPKESCK